MTSGASDSNAGETERRTIKLDKAIPRELLADVEDKLRYASEALVAFRIDPSRTDEIEIELSAGSEPQEVVSKVKRLVAQMATGWRSAPPRIRYEHRQALPPYNQDIWPELVHRGYVIERAPGQVSLQGLPLELFEYFDRRFVEIARTFTATEVRYPQMISVEALNQCQYFSSFPHHVTFCSHMREDLDILTAFSESQAKKEPFAFAEGLRAPEYVASPAVCFHAYHSLAGQRIEAPRVISTIGRCFRFESTAMTSLERLWDFTMREIIFIGPRDWILEQREKSIEQVRHLVEELNLHAWIETANDPFFVTNFVAKKYHQLLTNAKLELQLTLPFSDSSLAAASFNFHEDFFGRSYQVQVGESRMHTACTAFGLERWVYAFLCQYGPEPATWPTQVAESLSRA